MVCLGLVSQSMLAYWFLVFRFAALPPSVSFEALARFLAGFAMCLGLLVTPQGYAQDPLDIYVTVDRTPITYYDIDVRLALNQALGQAPADEARARTQIITTLIDEAIHSTVAAENGLLPPQDAIDGAFASLAASNGMDVSEFSTALTDGGVSVDAFRGRLGAQLTWNNILLNFLGPDAEVKDEELAEAWMDIQNASGQTEWLLTEVYVPNVDRNTALSLADRMRESGDFGLIARAESSSPSAARDGDLGWVRPNTLSPAVDQELEGLTAGDVTSPIPAPAGGYFIYAVRNSRAVGAADTREVFDLARLFITLDSQGQSATDREKLLTIDQAFRNIETCERFEQASAIYGEPGSGRLAGVSLNELPQITRRPIRALELQQFTPLLPDGNGASIYMKCGADIETIPLTQDQVRGQLRQQKLDEADEGLRIQLRRQAYIEYE